ncbi:hypothetical protein CTI12_AA515810 [Artemisia annua]|uniref:Uncharacterized protein n=1 Tax=Artemisia annua TaxID=35608 RepID=A0A2U1L9E9_ARTAN|nr:hypothetical protein CTI12_AA515810 [Artemisia annua]
MEERHGLVCEGFPPLCPKYPWLVSQSLETDEDGTGGQFFYTIHDPLFHYQCRIPELLENRIRGCFYGWMILSNNTKWSLWNPVTSKIIQLPPLILKDGECDDINSFCLSYPPDDPSSVLLLTRAKKSTFVFCRLDRKRKRLRWMEMSYVHQLKRISGNGTLVHDLTCCDGKVFALNTDGSLAKYVIHVDIVIRDKEVVIKLRLSGGCPIHSYLLTDSNYQIKYLKGYRSELFYLTVDFNEETKKTIGAVVLFKLDMASIIKCEKLLEGHNWDMTNWTPGEVTDEYIEDLIDITDMMWEELLDLNDAIFCVDLVRDHSVFYFPGIASEFGGYVHIRGVMGSIIHSYNFRDKTISLSDMPSQVLPTSHISSWDCRLEGDYFDSIQEVDDKADEIVVRRIMDDVVELNESHLLNLPFHLLEMILDHCVGVEYMNFRATCKRCHIAAPLIKWRDKSALRRLSNYSVVSPWLMVVDQEQGIITCTDPMLGDKYFMKKFNERVLCNKILCSRFGWLLYYNDAPMLVFYNPFTSDIRELPPLGNYYGRFCFSAPPTSPDCVVVGFSRSNIYIHYVAREQTWRAIHLDFGDAHPYSFPTFYGRDLYALCKEGKLGILKYMGGEDYSWEKDVSRAPTSSCTSHASHFLTKCNQNLLLVIVGFSGESVEVFNLNSTKEWEKIDGLGRHMIYISGTTCLCIEAKYPHMENKIYFPQLHSKSKRAVFYSLETCKYDTFNPKSIEEKFVRTSYEIHPHAWIEPTWS